MRPSRIALVAGLAVSFVLSTQVPAMFFAEPPAKKVVKTQDDLPRHTYKIEGRASEFLLSDAPFRAFVGKVKADVESDLALHQIDDRTTLQGYHNMLQQIALYEGRLDDALAEVEKIRELEAKESKKLMAGQMLAAMISAGKTAGAIKPGDAAFDAAFKAELDARVRALPWEKVKEEVNQAKGRAQIISRDLILGSIKGQLDPVVEAANGEVSGDLVRNLVGIRVLIDHMLPLQPAVAEVYGKIADDSEAMKVAAKDIWSPSQVALTEADRGSPVVIGIWDSGVDTTLFPGTLWVNSGETPGNGKDDDGNGFIDDVHGIAYDLETNRVPELLLNLSELRNDRALMQRFSKGFTDLNSNVASPEASAVRDYIRGLKQDEVTPFVEDLSLFGGFCHGTHVAGIAAAGNPFARILAARITFDHRSIPTHTPNHEQARKDAAETVATIDYFRAAGTRVVNMSWGGSRAGIEQALEKKNWGKSPEERASLSRELFQLQRQALDEAMRGASEILFIAAAGNSDNDNEFSETLPSGLNMPNMITIGAIDPSGKPTGFTTFGKNVKLYANGFEVESYLPGGERQKMSGTSMAAPNAANLAGKLLALDSSLTTQQVIELMEQGADPLEGYPGRFILNARKSIDMLKARRN